MSLYYPAAYYYYYYYYYYYLDRSMLVRLMDSSIDYIAYCSGGAVVL